MPQTGTKKKIYAPIAIQLENTNVFHSKMASFLFFSSLCAPLSLGGGSFRQDKEFKKKKTGGKDNKEAQEQEIGYTPFIFKLKDEYRGK